MPFVEDANSVILDSHSGARVARPNSWRNCTMMSTICAAFSRPSPPGWRSRSMRRRSRRVIRFHER